MSKFDWSAIIRDDVIKAIDNFYRYEVDCPKARSTFLIYNDKQLPAKHIRGMAYKVHFGKEISKQDYSGGIETKLFSNVWDLKYVTQEIPNSIAKKLRPKFRIINLKLKMIKI
ncbi:hypothetical protein [uncultured Ruminococcus sp.]|uniref:hypothetical protein n=1 Tax=uncultured Ruminococcus sp. TaxID=165186 RepID=UPI0025E6E5D7|nr:hypothetical protein [uncultured Ruminococcus sp.]